LTLLRRFVEARADELRRSESSLDVTLAGIGDGVITTDRDGKVLYLGRMAASALALGEPLSGSVVVGALTIVAGLVLSLRAASAPRHQDKAR